MPKVSRRKSKINKLEVPLRQRKFAVAEKEVIEKIIQQGEVVESIPVNQPDIHSKDIKKKKRHEAWLEKLDHAYTLKKKQAKKNSMNSLKVDLGGFNDILDSIELKPREEVSEATKIKNRDNTEKAIPSNKIKSRKAKKNAEMVEILRMQKVMQHGAFQQNPIATISQHIQNKFL
ncbi:ribosome biogenesis protein SLX9-domain-containing protein [Pilobolus umbonatus]|nr:ribosome biogenesis protein SLX9-domain-containing protein [Pilobolus umbonatus]